MRQLEGHQGRVWSVAFSPDGATIASGSNDQTIRLWEVATGTTIRSYQGHQAVVRSAAFSPDGKYLVSGGEDQTVRFWEAATGKQVRVLRGHTGVIRSVIFSPDGKTLASGSDDQTIRLWDAATGKEIRPLAGHAEEVRVVAFSPDGKFLASGGDDRTVRLWSTVTGKTLRVLTAHRGKVFSIAFAPDGRNLASGSPDFTTRWSEVATGQEALPALEYHDWVASVAVSPDGRKVASGSSDGTVLVWDITGWSGPGGPPKGELSAKELRDCWNDLADEDARKAHQAIWALSAAPGQAVPFLSAHLRPDTSAGAQQIQQWVRDLDDQQFGVRKRASAALEKQGWTAIPELRRALQGKPSLELRRRAEDLLKKVEESVPVPAQLRTLRALQVLEQIGSPGARQVLRSLTEAGHDSWLRNEAQAALERLSKRAARQ
jgi:hypothetical protein